MPLGSKKGFVFFLSSFLPPAGRRKRREKKVSQSGPIQGLKTLAKIACPPGREDAAVPETIAGPQVYPLLI
jgi:hypothetical protein